MSNRLRAFTIVFLVVSAQVAIDGELTYAQVPETTVLAVDEGAFARLLGADRLRPGRLEKTGIVDLPVKLPVLGAGENFGADYSGLESISDAADRMIYDRDRGEWYAQEFETIIGTVLIEGEVRRMRTDIANAFIGRAEAPSLGSPQVQFFGDDAIDVTTLRPFFNSPVEVMASFQIGGALYRLTLTCNEESIALCADEDKVLELVNSLEVLGRGTAQ